MGSALHSCKHLQGWVDHSLSSSLSLASTIYPAKTQHLKSAYPRLYLTLVNINYYHNLRPKLQMFTVILGQLLKTFSLFSIHECSNLNVFSLPEFSICSSSGILDCGIPNI